MTKRPSCYALYGAAVVCAIAVAIPGFAAQTGDAGPQVPGGFPATFDAGGGLVGSSFADDGTDPDGRLIAVVDAGAGNNVIASFRASTPVGDTFGVLRICLDDPGPIPVELQTLNVE
jgi:hypothetical protein